MHHLTEEVWENTLRTKSPMILEKVKQKWL